MVSPKRAHPSSSAAEIFAQQRKDNVDLSGVAVIEPQLTLLPQIEANGMLHMAGFFPSVPTQVNFELMYAPVGGRWEAVRHLGVVRPSCPAGAATTRPKSPAVGGPRQAARATASAEAVTWAQPFVQFAHRFPSGSASARFLQSVNLDGAGRTSRRPRGGS